MNSAALLCELSQFNKAKLGRRQFRAAANWSWFQYWKAETSLRFRLRENAAISLAHCSRSRNHKCVRVIPTCYSKTACSNHMSSSKQTTFQPFATWLITFAAGIHIALDNDEFSTTRILNHEQTRHPGIHELVSNHAKLTFWLIEQYAT